MASANPAQSGAAKRVINDGRAVLSGMVPVPARVKFSALRRRRGQWLRPAPRLPVNIQRASGAQGLALINAGRSGFQMQIRRQRADEERVHTRQAVGIVACSLPVGSEGGVGHVFPDPRAIRPASGSEEQVVIHFVASHHRAPTLDEAARSVGVDDVVLDGVVAGVKLDK